MLSPLNHESPPFSVSIQAWVDLYRPQQSGLCPTGTVDSNRTSWDFLHSVTHTHARNVLFLNEEEKQIWKRSRREVGGSGDYEACVEGRIRRVSQWGSLCSEDTAPWPTSLPFAFSQISLLAFPSLPLWHLCSHAHVTDNLRGGYIWVWAIETDLKGSSPPLSLTVYAICRGLC